MNGNKMDLRFSALPENEAFARLAVSAFVLPLNPNLEEMEDVKTAVSEAVTNAIIHGYQGKGGEVRLQAQYEGESKSLCVEISDEGVGIADIQKAREPLFTSRPDLERSGMGFAVMESFMDQLEVQSALGKGTKVRMTKRFT